MNTEIFKICSKCNTHWNSLNDFMKDSKLIVIGYQAVLSNPIKGMFLFNHCTSGCNTTIAIPLVLFAPLIKQKIPEGEFQRLPDCKGLCLDPNNVQNCESSFCLGQITRDLLKKFNTR